MAADGAIDIDTLLERYLLLLDEYSKLRAALNATQGRMYQSLARANSSAERGVWFGQDFYDDRMQAGRRLRTATSKSGLPTFEVVQDQVRSPEAAKDTDKQEVDPHGNGAGGRHGGEDDGGNAVHEKAIPMPPKDPLKWFGLVTPMALRWAQDQAVQAVEQTIPRLASVSLELADLEIQVRRARKKRAKAEAAERKSGLAQGEQREAAVV